MKSWLENFAYYIPGELVGVCSGGSSRIVGGNCHINLSGFLNSKGQPGKVTKN